MGRKSFVFEYPPLPYLRIKVILRARGICTKDTGHTPSFFMSIFPAITYSSSIDPSMEKLISLSSAVGIMYGTCMSICNLRVVFWDTDLILSELWSGKICPPRPPVSTLFSFDPPRTHLMALIEVPPGVLWSSSYPPPCSTDERLGKPASSPLPLWPSGPPEESYSSSWSQAS